MRQDLAGFAEDVVSATSHRPEAAVATDGAQESTPSTSPCVQWAAAVTERAGSWAVGSSTQVPCGAPWVSAGPRGHQVGQRADDLVDRPALLQVRVGSLLQ